MTRLDAFGDTSFDSGSGMDSDFPPHWFIAIVIVMFVVVIGLGIASAIWRASTARSIAARNGMDPDDAAAMSLLTEHGLEATYLASNLHPAAEPPVPPTRTTAQRLAELAELRASGAITEDEYSTRRQAIVEAI